MYCLLQDNLFKILQYLQSHNVVPNTVKLLLLSHFINFIKRPSHILRQISWKVKQIMHTIYIHNIFLWLFSYIFTYPGQINLFNHVFSTAFVDFGVKIYNFSSFHPTFITKNLIDSLAGNFNKIVKYLYNTIYVYIIYKHCFNQFSLTSN